MTFTPDIRQKRYEQAAARNELIKKVMQARKAKKNKCLGIIYHKT